jgi:hypothetical protein
VPDAPPSRRRTFGPVVVLGVAAGVLASVAGTQPWATAAGATAVDGSATYASSLALTADSGEVPAANALALVTLACWGVVLVTRGRFRRYVAALGLIAALGTVVAVVVAFGGAPDSVRSAFGDLGVAEADLDVTRTGWFWIGGTAAVVALAAWLAAVRFVGDWPEMGGRYDTPSDSPPEDLWKALDQGHDPTS